MKAFECIFSQLLQELDLAKDNDSENGKQGNNKGNRLCVEIACSAVRVVLFRFYVFVILIPRRRYGIFMERHLFLS